MLDMFPRMIFGHLFGDYLFQNDWMTRNKWKPGPRNAGICAVHCLVYTIIMAIFLWKIEWYHLVLIFLSHYPIDRYSIAKHFMKLKGNRVDEIMKSGDALPTSFTVFVYIVIDNTMHLFILWIIFGVLGL